MEKAKRDEQLAKIDIAKKTDDVIFGRSEEKRKAFNNDPDVMVIKESKRVRDDQAARLNAKYGTKYTPQYWGTYIEKQVEGGSYVRPADNPNYVSNTSIPVERTETVVETDLGGGQKGYLTAEDAVKEGEQNKRFNATTSVGIAKEDANNKIEIDKANATNEAKWQSDVTDTLTKIATATIGLGNAETSKAVSDLQTEMAEAQEAYVNATTEQDAAKAKAAFEAASTQIQNKMRSTKEGREALSKIKLPPKPKRIPYTSIKVNSGAAKVASGADVTRFAKQFKVSPERAKQHFIDSGYTIQ
jgi:hypothetical protein